MELQLDRLFGWLHREPMGMLTKSLVPFMKLHIILVLVHACDAQAKRKCCGDS